MDYYYLNYSYSLGHTLSGFVVPGRSKRSTTVEKVGMVHPVEPGIYLKGVGVVSIEENVVVTEDGWEKLKLGPRRY